MKIESIENGVIKMLFCGDFISRDPQKITLSNEFKQVLDECDIKCLNFEGSLAIGNPINIKGTAVLQQSLDSPAWCESNGFNLISLANNHMGDFGQSALIATIKAFKSSVLVGAGNWDEAYKVKVVEASNVKIGFLALAQNEFGILNDKWANADAYGCAWINHLKVNKIIEDSKKELDYLIVIAHAGIEYINVPLPEWRDRYKDLIDAGADAIIGGHPHVPQGWELYKGKPIFYSLGNFYFDRESNAKYWNNGLAVVLKIDNQKQISFEVLNITKDNYKIFIDTANELKKHNDLNCKLLIDENKYLSMINSICLKLWPSYEGITLRSLNGEKTTFTLKNIAKFLSSLIKNRKNEYRYLLNNLRCESHRYVMSRAIKLQTNVKI